MAEREEKNEKDLEALLRERTRIDELLKSRYSRDVTIMFSDIKGSTAIFESRGDIEGRAMIQQHNELLFPLIERHGGKVIKTMGDAIMSSFKEPLQAVKSAIDTQKALFLYNQGKEEPQQIQVRIGIDTGRGLVETEDVFGEVVIVAARLENIAQPEQILISKQVYEKVKNSDEVICRYLDTKKLKGISEALEVYRVVWGEEEMVVGPTRAAEKPPLAMRKKRKVLQLEITREGEKLKISTFEKREQEEKTIKPYEESSISLSRVEERCKEIEDLLGRANIRGMVSTDILRQLKDAGQLLYDELLILQAKRDLKSTQAEDLILSIDDGLVQIPWELLFDGEQFLCQRFNMGRLVRTRQRISGVSERRLEKPLKMLILTDPRGNLKDANAEGKRIREEMDKNPSLIHANHKSGHTVVEYVKEKIQNFDIVHYAGHADYDQQDPSRSGWIFEDGKFTSSDIIQMIGAKPFPALVFSNACQSGQTEEWKIGEGYSKRIYGLANAFLLAGVQHYIGTFWEILDRPSSLFSREFYRAMTEGCPIGEAVRKARMSLIREYGEDTIVWASYMLYGDPTFSYLDVSEREEVKEAEGEKQRITSPSRSSEEIVIKERVKEKRNLLKRVAAIIFLIIMAGVLSRIGVGIWKRSQDKTGEYNPSSEAYTSKGMMMEKAGRLDEAVSYYEKALKENPNDSFASVFLKEAKRKVGIAHDRERQEKIDALVQDLLKASREKGMRPKETDTWTSRPLTLTFFPLERKGGLASSREGEEEYIVLKLTSSLQSEGGIKVVEREILDKLLQELKLSTTQLVDQETSLKVGRILAARLIGTGSIVQVGSKSMLTLKFIETETTRVIAAFSESIDQPQAMDALMKKIAQEIISKLKKEYPLRGKITSIEGDKVTINIGSDQGMRKGLSLRVLSKTMEEAGLIEVVSVNPGQSQAKVIKKIKDLVPGARIEELIEG
ncbi:MAG: CHAT domain-containing protein [Proteobacteria bacterium]|nr:CHAT domain-containing protein [Pseudomonadota bacterium]